MTEIPRRDAIIAGAGAGLAGLAAARPDQQYYPAAGGAQIPGSRTGKIRANQVIITGTGPNAGLFVYSGTPKLGNSPVFAVVAPGVTHDPFGNAVVSIMIAGNLAGAFTQIDGSGDILMYNASGGQVIVINPVKQAMFIYSPQAGAGNLIASIANIAGTDAFGNAYLTGSATYQSGSPFTAQASVGGVTNFYTAPGGGGPWTQVAQVSTGSGDLIFQSSRNIAISNLLVATAAALGSGVAQFLVSGDTNSRFVWDTTAGGVARFRIGPGNATPDVNIARPAAGGLQVTVGAAPNLISLVTADLDISTVGRGLQIAEGANARMGLATLVGGTQTIANTTITANTRIFLSRQNLNGTPGHLSVNRTVGVNFTINSSTNLDTSQVAWLLVEPG